jgi:ADP-ribose pyrophosphatase
MRRNGGVTAYERLRAERPELFTNDPGGVDILVEPDEIRAARESVGADEPVGVVYTDRFVTLVRDAVRFPGGRLGLYVRLLHNGPTPGAVILPLLNPPEAEDGGDGAAGGVRIVLVEHYRHATRAWHWEAPRGLAEAGDRTPGESARRELDEETGSRAEELIPLGSVHPDTGLIGGSVALYAARIGGVGLPAAGEGIRRVEARPWREVERMIGAGEITDSFTIAAFTRARCAGLLGP